MSQDFQIEKTFNKFEIETMFNSMQNDLATIVDENIALLKGMVEFEVIDSMKDLGSNIDTQIESAKKLYVVLGSDSVTATALAKFLTSLQKEIRDSINDYKVVNIFVVPHGNNITVQTFFMVFVKIIFMMQLAFLMGESFEAKMDSDILNEEYERMKREGLI